MDFHCKPTTLGSIGKHFPILTPFVTTPLQIIAMKNKTQTLLVTYSYLPVPGPLLSQLVLSPSEDLTVAIEMKRSRKSLALSTQSPVSGCLGRIKMCGLVGGGVALGGGLL